MKAGVRVIDKGGIGETTGRHCTLKGAVGALCILAQLRLELHAF